jgi:hypothetical protein
MRALSIVHGSTGRSLVREFYPTGMRFLGIIYILFLYKSMHHNHKDHKVGTVYSDGSVNASLCPSYIKIPKTRSGMKTESKHENPQFLGYENSVTALCSDKFQVLPICTIINIVQLQFFCLVSKEGAAVS